MRSWAKEESSAAKLFGLPKVKTESVFGNITPSLIGIKGITFSISYSELGLRLSSVEASNH